MIEHHVPCHMPSFKTIFVKHSSVVDLLCNHKSAIESWSLSQTPQCCCANWSTFRSAALNPSSDHWVLSGSALTSLLPTAVAVLAEGSLRNKVFPQKQEFLSPPQRGILQWCRQNGLPSMPKSTIQVLGPELWTSHLSHLTHHITRSSIKQLEQLFPGAVFHCEDKHASSLRIFCPCLYHQAIEKTFLDPEVFAPIPHTPQYITSTLVLSLGYRQRSSTSLWLHLGQKEEGFHPRTSNHFFCGCSFSTDAEHSRSRDFSAHPHRLPGPLCHWLCLSPSPHTSPGS